MKSVLRDTFFLLIYSVIVGLNSWYLTNIQGPYWVTALSLIAQGFIFVGFMEAFHQAVHMNLHPWKPVNMVLGWLTGAQLGLGFSAYRRFHITHHSNTNTADDPEKAFYVKPASRFGLILYPFVYLFRNASIVNSGKYLSQNELTAHRLEMTSVFIFRVITLIATYFYPLQMLMAYWLPYYLFFYLELLISQSQHYFSDEQLKAPRGIEHYQASVNIDLPWPLGFLCMHTNLHATHHVRASTKWYETPFSTRKDKQHIVNVGFIKFVHLTMSNGARQWRTLSP